MFTKMFCIIFNPVVLIFIIIGVCLILRACGFETIDQKAKRKKKEKREPLFHWYEYLAMIVALPVLVLKELLDRK